jgi:phage terminase small subunit
MGARGPLPDDLGDTRPLAGAPTRPASVKGDAATVWTYTLRQLRDNGQLSRTDALSIERYARDMVAWRKAEAFAAEFGSLTKPPRGVKKADFDKLRTLARRKRAEANELDTHLRQFERDFGLCPASRARLRVDRSATPEVSARKR